MSRSLNRVYLLGRTGADPEVRTTPGGRRVASFSLATSRRTGGGEGGAERTETTEWHRVVVWDPLVASVERSVRKGDRLFVEGRLETRSWSDRAGRQRYVTEIVAEDVVRLDR